MLYEFPSVMGDITSLIFSFGCIWMAHSLYQTPRKLWQIIGIWLVSYLLCALGTTALQAIYPHILYERLGMYVGVTAIIAYLYLFPHIPVSQRIFVYLFVYTTMYCCMLLPRALSLLIAPPLNYDPDQLFVPIYITLNLLFVFVMQKYLLDYLRRALHYFERYSISLTLFATLAYLNILLFFDPWATLPALSLYDFAVIFLVMLTMLGGYALSFRTMINISEQSKLNQLAEAAQLQAQLAQREYRNSMESIAQIRKIRHDISHHLRSLHALAIQNSDDEIIDYIEPLLQEIPTQALGSRNFITDSFLEYYREQCATSAVAFTAEIRYDESKLSQKNQLGILLGNALKNAFEAASNSQIPQPFIKITAHEKGTQIVFLIENSYSGQLNPNYTSTKNKDRGFGLASIRSATEQSGGYLSLSHTEDVFTLKAVIPTINPPREK